MIIINHLRKGTPQKTKKFGHQNSSLVFNVSFFVVGGPQLISRTGPLGVVKDWGGIFSFLTGIPESFPY